MGRPVSCKAGRLLLPLAARGSTWRRFVLGVGVGVGIKPVGADRERLASTPFGHHPPCLRSPESKLLPQLHPQFPCVASRRCSPAAVAARHHLVSYPKPELRPRQRRFSWQRHRAPLPFQASARAAPEQLLVADRSSPSGVSSAGLRRATPSSGAFSFRR
jgi:hypothetical protein